MIPSLTRSSFTGIGVAVIALCLIPLFAGEYLLSVFIMTLFWIMLTAGLNLLGAMGYTSICHCAFYGIGGYISALLTLKMGFPFVLSLAAGTLGAGLIGLLIGYPAFRVRGHYFAIITLAFGLIIALIFSNWRQVTGGDRGLTGILSPIPSTEGYYYLTLGAALAVIWVTDRILRSSFGRQLVAIQEDEDLAQQMGIHTMRCKLIAFALGALLAGFAGGLMVHYVNFVHPDFFSFGYSFNVIMGMLMGGVGTTVGAILGGVISIWLPEALRFTFGLRYIVMGIVLILVMSFMPKGIVGTIADNLREKKRIRQ